jgi:hypothetical protein
MPVALIPIQSQPMGERKLTVSNAWVNGKAWRDLVMAFRHDVHRPTVPHALQMRLSGIAGPFEITASLLYSPKDNDPWLCRGQRRCSQTVFAAKNSSVKDLQQEKFCRSTTYQTYIPFFFALAAT